MSTTAFGLKLAEQQSASARIRRPSASVLSTCPRERRGEPQAVPCQTRILLFPTAGYRRLSALPIRRNEHVQRQHALKIPEILASIFSYARLDVNKHFTKVRLIPLVRDAHSRQKLEDVLHWVIVLSASNTPHARWKQIGFRCLQKHVHHYISQSYRSACPKHLKTLRFHKHFKAEGAYKVG